MEVVDGVWAIQRGYLPIQSEKEITEYHRLKKTKDKVMDQVSESVFEDVEPDEGEGEDEDEELTDSAVEIVLNDHSEKGEINMRESIPNCLRKTETETESKTESKSKSKTAMDAKEERRNQRRLALGSSLNLKMKMKLRLVRLRGVRRDGRKRALRASESMRKGRKGGRVGRVWRGVFLPEREIWMDMSEEDREDREEGDEGDEGDEGVEGEKMGWDENEESEKRKSYHGSEDRWGKVIWTPAGLNALLEMIADECLVRSGRCPRVPSIYEIAELSKRTEINEETGEAQMSDELRVRIFGEDNSCSLTIPYLMGCIFVTRFKMGGRIQAAGLVYAMEMESESGGNFMRVVNEILSRDAWVGA
jgi:hypothetical protein